MTLSITLPSDAEIRLREQAAAAGKDIAVFVREAIEEKLAAGQPATLPRQGSPEWLAEFNAWVASHPSRPHLADDSRDAIYGDERA